MSVLFFTKITSFYREEREWREWVDSHFIHLISPNVYRTWSESLETFRWFEQVGDWQQNFPTWERILAVYVGAAAMFAISKRLKKRYG
jgi:microsomal prostaglandin-E synthase 2